MADAHDTQFMADLAKIFEDDHEMHLHHHVPAPAVTVQQHSGTAQQPGDTPSPPMDPFLLQGGCAWQQVDLAWQSPDSLHGI